MGIAPRLPFHVGRWRGSAGEIGILICEAVEKGSYDWLTLLDQLLHNTKGDYPEGKWESQHYFARTRQNSKNNCHCPENEGFPLPEKILR
jgi:hypothetical protein